MAKTHSPYHGHSPFEAANDHDKSVIFWKAELNHLEDDLRSKDRIEARVLDLYRNNDILRGLIEKQIDFDIGARVVLQAMPDYETLGATEEQAKQWAKLAETEFHYYADSPENWISADRTMDFTQLLRAADRSKIMSGEMFASREWRQSPLGYSTCFQLISSHRVKDPKKNASTRLNGTTSDDNNRSTGRKVFFGIEMDRFNAPVAYHIESARLDQRRSFGNKTTKRYAKYNSFGWLQLFHVYEPMTPEYPRGISRLSCVLKKIKGIDRYSEADLDKAIIGASYVFAITSDETPDSVADMLSGANDPKYQAGEFAATAASANIPQDVLDKRDEILESITTRYIETTGGQVVHLFSGEKMEVVQPTQNQGSHQDYVKGHTKSIANGMGISYELGTGDFTGINFSAGQLSLGVHEHSANIQRRLYIHKLARLFYRSWLDEAMDKGRLPLLNGQPYFANRERYSRCEFTGSTQVQADPVKRARADEAELGMGVTSRTEIAARKGSSIETVVQQRAREAELAVNAIIETASKLGLDISGEARLKMLIDFMSGKNVAPPQMVVETDGET